MGSKRVSERRDENDVHANRADKRGKAATKERLPSNPQNGSSSGTVPEMTTFRNR